MLDESLLANRRAYIRERFAKTSDDGSVIVWKPLSVTRALAILGPAFDAVRRS